MKKDHVKEIMICILVLGFWTFGFVLSAVAAPGNISTIAGGLIPYDVFVDGSGNIYIVDKNNHRISKVDTSGIMTTVAGNGTFGFSGDGGTATSASMSYPEGVFVDGSGNIYIADTENNRIRKVDTSGIISTVAGNGNRGFSGDGGAATSASMWYPVSVFVDGLGNIYIAITINSRIRKVDTSGNINTVAGNGTLEFYGDGRPATRASLRGPSSVFVDGLGNIYIADTINNRIRKVDTSGIISTVAGNGNRGFSGDRGPATRARLYSPSGVFVDGWGIIYIADRLNHRIRKVDTSGIISTVAGNGNRGFSGDGGPAKFARLHRPTSVFVDGLSNIYIADTGNRRIRKVEGFPAPVVPPFNPNSGTELGGTSVTITWNNFQSGSTVTFDGVEATIVVVLSPNTIIARTPSHPAGIVDVIVTNPNGHVNTFKNGFEFIVVPDLVGDFNGDNEVGLSDFVRLLDVFGVTTTPANSIFDLDGNGEIGLFDFVIFLDNFGRPG